MQEVHKEEEIEGWIVDVHTHIFPPRLALKIRGFFDTQIRQSSNEAQGDDIVALTRANTSSSSSCCNGVSYNYPFRDQEEWKEDDFINHGSFSLSYHPFDPIELTREQRRNGIESIWVLPYAHKAAISSALNIAIVDLCTALEQKGGDGQVEKEGTLKGAVPAFTVHPDDGAESVRQCARQAILGGARAAKLHCSVGRYSVLNTSLVPFWELADRVLFPVTVHLGSSASGNTASQELDDVEQLLIRYPHVRLIIAHSGHPAVLKAIKLALRFDNIYLDTTPVVTIVPSYPPSTHPLYTPLMQLARSGRVLFGSDMPNVAVPLANQIQAVFETFADSHWKPPKRDKWWTDKQEAHRAGLAVEQVLFAASHTLLLQVDVSKADKESNM